MTYLVAVGLGAFALSALRLWRLSLALLAIGALLLGGAMAHDYITIVRPCAENPDAFPPGGCLDADTLLGLWAAIAILSVGVTAIGFAQIGRAHV